MPFAGLKDAASAAGPRASDSLGPQAICACRPFAGPQLGRARAALSRTPPAIPALFREGGLNSVLILAWTLSLFCKPSQRLTARAS